MNDFSPTEYEAVNAVLAEIGAMERAAEAHGTLSGMVCVHGQDATSPWLAGILKEAQSGSSSSLPVLEDLARDTLRSLEEGDMSFTLLLPDDEIALELRTESLSQWCQGFMHGLGIAHGGKTGRNLFDSQITQEIVQDFSEITRAAFSDQETEEEGEASYLEVMEYVRVSVQLVYEELHSIRTGKNSGVH